MPLDHYSERVERLREEPLKNIEISSNQISGTVDLSTDKVLCLTVPYENGWEVYVDGKKTDILRANYAFMGLRLSAGHHEILFKYNVPYLLEGSIVSLICVLITVMIIIVEKRNRKMVEPSEV